MQNSSDQQKDAAIEDKVFGNLNILQKSIRSLDERGLILSLAAFAEDALGLLLKAFMLPTESTKQLLDCFNAPLGTFSARIKATYSFGLITKGQYEDLEHLRKIRNEFAHSWQPIDFSHPKIAAHIKSMNYSSFDENFPETPLDKVRASISSLLIEIRSAAHQIEEQGKRVQVIGSRLMALFPGDFGEQIEAAKRDLKGFEENICEATGERLNFFRIQIDRFDVKIKLLALNAPKERQAEVMALVAAVDVLKKIFKPKSEQHCWLNIDRTPIGGSHT